MADGWGGARPGAGRPKGSKSQSTLMREKALEEADGDARRAFAKFIEWGDDESLDNSFRFMCYKEVLDRVWGKPTQRNENVNTGDLDMYIHWDDA